MPSNKRRKKSPTLVRNPTFEVHFDEDDDDEEFIETKSPSSAANFLQEECIVTMQAELLNTCEPYQIYNPTITTSNIIEMTIMFRSGMWKICTADHIYHIIDW